MTALLVFAGVTLLALAIIGWAVYQEELDDRAAR
jgi:hypothetical protein